MIRPVFSAPLRAAFALTALSAALVLGTPLPAPAQERAGSGLGIAAIVDDHVISTLDVADRMALIIGSTGINDSPETRARLLPQVLRQLIEEQLQMQEASKLGITISEDRLREGVALVEKQSGKPPGSILAMLDSRGLPKASFYAQVKAQLAWSEIVIRNIRPRIHISDQELARTIKRREKAEEAPQAGPAQEVQIIPLLLPVDAPANEANVKKLASKLAGEIQAGASFSAVAAQFSSTTGPARVPEPFWVELSQLDPAIAQALATLPKDGVTAPVRTPNGYQIIKLVDKRASAKGPAGAMTAHEDNAELAFKQILMRLKPDAKRKEAELLLGLAKEVAKSPGKCTEDTIAGSSDLADLDFKARFRRDTADHLPEKLRALLLALTPGQVSEPVITPQGVWIFMLCEKMEMPSTAVAAKPAAAPAEESLRQSLYEEKIELEAQKYLRNLRQEAFIEVRQHAL